MTDRRNRDKGRNKSEPVDPDSSNEILLDQMKRTYSDPEMPAITNEEEAVAIEREKTAQAVKRNDTLPPWSSDEIRRQQIRAWNEMAKRMVDVVRTIKTSETKMAQTDRRRWYVALFIVFTAVVAVAVNWWQGEKMIAQAAAHQSRIEKKLDENADRQTKLLSAVAKLAEAQASGIEASADGESPKDKIAKVQALEAQKAALEARLATETDPDQRDRTDRKIERVDKAAEDAKADAPAPPRGE